MAEGGAPDVVVADSGEDVEDRWLITLFRPDGSDLGMFTCETADEAAGLIVGFCGNDEKAEILVPAQLLVQLSEKWKNTQTFLEGLRCGQEERTAYKDSS